MVVVVMTDTSFLYVHYNVRMIWGQYLALRENGVCAKIVSGTIKKLAYSYKL